jgi:hypothetical protein
MASNEVRTLPIGIYESFQWEVHSDRVYLIIHPLRMKLEFDVRAFEAFRAITNAVDLSKPTHPSEKPS